MEDLNKSFEASIFSEDLAVDYSELALDKLIDNEVLKEVPVIKTILAIYRTGIGIRDAFNLKKINKFLFQLNNITEDERTKFLNKLKLDEQYKNSIIEKLLILLDRLDDIDKAEITGNLFKATIQGNITIDTFLKLVSIVDKSFIMDIKCFCFEFDYALDKKLKDEIENTRSYFCSTDIKKNFSSMGLMREKIVTKQNQLQFGSSKLLYSFQYDKTELGDIFATYAKPTFRNAQM